MFSWHVGKERGYSDVPTPCGRLSSIALPPQLPSFPPQAFPTTVSSLMSLSLSPCQSTADLTLGLFSSLSSSPQPLCFLEDLCPCPCYIWLAMIVCVILIPFRMSQVSCFTLKCVSVPNNCPSVGFDPASSSLTLQTSPVLLTVLFPHLLALSCQVLHGSIHSFLVVNFFLPTLSWCSARFSVSESCIPDACVKERYYMSLSSSAIIIH